MNEVKIKFCGFTKKSDILEAIRLNIDYVGFIMVENSQRYISFEDSIEIIESLPKNQTKKVAVVQNPPENLIKKIIESELFDAIQFHGEESSELCQNYKKQIEVWKAFSVTTNEYCHSEQNEESPQIEEIKAYKNSVDKILLDLPKNADSEKSFSAIETYRKLEKEGFDLALAGGINLENIEFYLKELNPKTIDIARGIESKPGKKDTQKMGEIMEIIHQFQEPNRQPL